MEQSPVRRATSDETSELAAVLARAFAHDPYFGWLAGEGSERNHRMREAWAAILRFASAGMRETWTNAARSGVAVWIPPGRAPSSVVDSFRLLPSFTRLTGWRRIREASAAVEHLEHRRRFHVPEPHYYLSALGVDPPAQGQGVGSSLMAPVLAQADETATPAYLETATARNVLLYERHGFAVVEELVLPRTDVHGWLMRRSPPRAAAAPDPAAPGRSRPPGSG